MIAGPSTAQAAVVTVVDQIALVRALIAHGIALAALVTIADQPSIGYGERGRAFNEERHDQKHRPANHEGSARPKSRRACSSKLDALDRMRDAGWCSDQGRSTPMHGDVFILERPDQPVQRAARIPLGDTRGRNEAWLRDTLFAHPDALPVADIDPAFGPLLPLCRELRTEAGPLDIAFINPHGNLTLVECKLWRNPEARRKVVAQILDYARAITRWSYADLQRQVSIASGRKGNVPFEVARAAKPALEEHRFADAVVRAMRAGRFLLLIAGDGIREDVGALAELVNRNAASGFSLGIVEVALYDLGGDALAIQPRVSARTHLIERQVVVVRGDDTYLSEVLCDDGTSFTVAATPSLSADGSAAGSPELGGTTSRNALLRAEYERWWQPVAHMLFDDPEQSSPEVRWANHVRVSLPWQNLWITAYRDTRVCGVFLAGREEVRREFLVRAEAEFDDLGAILPEGTLVEPANDAGAGSITTRRTHASFTNDDEKRAWLMAALNGYVNALRPLAKRLS